ncbi:MAG: acetate--CoA ligase family protein [bacterium]
MDELDRIFKAQSVAVIGASKDEGERGYQVIKTLLEEKYEGQIYPINPHEDSILGLRCYRSISDIDRPIDVAFIATPAATVSGIIDKCCQARIAGAVIVAGGFGETGEEGRKVESRMAETARKHHLRFVGPNTSGLISVHNKMNLVGLRDVPKGNIALLTQSGNVALHLITEAKLRSNEGFSHYVGVGNEADLKFHEYLRYFRGDPNTRAIIIYVEGLRDGRRFLQEAQNTALTKPIILLKSGRSSTGKKSAGSHTGSLAGISEVARTAFMRAGIITIENPDELFPVAESLAILPPIKNNRIAILADGGGHATIAADLLSDCGVAIPPLESSTRNRLEEILPPNASVRNPVDVAGGTDTNPAIFADCAQILLEDKGIGGLLIVGLFGGYGIRFAKSLTFIEEDAAHRMGKLVKRVEKPIVLQSLYNFAKPHSLELLRYYKIPVYDSLDIACRCIGCLAQYGEYLGVSHKKANFVFSWGAKAKARGRAIVENALSEKRSALSEFDAKELLRLHGAPVNKDRLATTADEAVEIATSLKKECALKLASVDILHKSDAGGVRLNLRNEQKIRTAFHDIIRNGRKFNKKAKIDGCLVAPMVGKGLEIIIGTKIDDQFGPVIVFGLGGILVEVLQDVVFRVLPISRNAARKMVTEIRTARLLKGVRGKPPVDREAIIDLLLTVSEIIEAYPEIREMDLNPVIVHEKSITIVDARIILNKVNMQH